MSTLPQAAEAGVRRSFLVDSAGSFVMMGMCLAVRLATNVLIARFLGPAGKGAITLVQLLVGQANSYLVLGLDTAIVHFVGRRGWSPPVIAARVLGLAISLGALGFLFLSVLLLTAFRNVIPGELQFLTLLLAATVPLTLSGFFLRGIIRACGRILEEWTLTFLTALTILIGVAVALFAGGGAPGVLWALLAASVIAAGYNFVLAWRIGILKSPPVLDWKGSKELVSYGAKLHVGNVLESLNDRFDMYIVAFFLGTSAVGIYSVSVVVAELLWLLPGVLSSVLMQRVATRSDEGANAIMGPMNRLTALVMFVAAVGAALLGGFAIRLVFGEAFADAYLPMVLLLPGVWAMGLWKNLTSDLSVRGYPTYKGYTAGMAVLVTIVLDFALIPVWGVPGAAAASTVAYWAAFLMALHIYCRVTGFSLRQILFPARSDFSVAYDLLRRGRRNRQ